MKHYFKLLFFIFSFWSITLYSTNNIPITQYFSATDLDQASISVLIKDVAGKTIASYDSNKPLIPASTLKIITTATALEFYGGKFKIPTVIGVDVDDNQHIIVQGYGDPTLGSEHVDIPSKKFLDLWTNALSKKLDKNKPVRITVIDDYFGYEGISSKWPSEDLGNYYAAGAYGVSVFDNMYRIHFNTLRAGVPTIVKTVPTMDDNIVFDNKLKLNKGGGDKSYINGLPFSGNRYLTGSIPAKRKAFVVRGDIPDPGSYMAFTLASKLKVEGYNVTSFGTNREKYFEHMQNQEAFVPQLLDPVYVINSPDLANIARVVNVYSNNHYAEHLLRLVGRYANDDVFVNALQEGIGRTKFYWNSKGIDVSNFTLYDGSGLSPSNRVTTETLVDILLYMNNKSAHSDAFIASFPEAGREGTVRSLLKETVLQGHVFVKSGSISGVQCFSGYYIKGDKKYAFAVMVNNFKSPRKSIVKAIEKLLLDYLD